MARLLLKLDDVVLGEYAISEKPVSVGRLPDNTIQVDHMSVSGHHARIVEEAGEVVLYDANSTNGTYVNGQKVSRAVLVNGDTVHVGRHILVFEDESLPEVFNQASKFGTLTVLNGKTDRRDYVLDSAETVIGKGDHAKVQLQRWFAPKIAAIITRRDGKYFISESESALPVRVNTEVVHNERELAEGDTILVDEISMIFQFQR